MQIAMMEILIRRCRIDLTPLVRGSFDQMVRGCWQINNCGIRKANTYAQAKVPLLLRRSGPTGHTTEVADRPKLAQTCLSGIQNRHQIMSAFETIRDIHFPSFRRSGTYPRQTVPPIPRPACHLGRYRENPQNSRATLFPCCKKYGGTGGETLDIPVGPDDSTSFDVLQGFVVGSGDGFVGLFGGFWQERYWAGRGEGFRYRLNSIRIFYRTANL